MMEPDTDSLLRALFDRDAAAQRRALAKAITLAESTRSVHRMAAERLLDGIIGRAGQSFRLGITGSPGVGKSTFVESLGMAAVERGHRVAVLCIDPSSSISNGAILGDKTRMSRLADSASAFIRPSAGWPEHRGVAQNTQASIRLCEAASYDFVIVETVGAGQNEYAAAMMTDMLLLVHAPVTTDALQVIKRGLFEHVDMVVVNKSDDAPDLADRVRDQIASALRLARCNAAPSSTRDRGFPPIAVASALSGAGVPDVLDQIDRYRCERAAETAKRRRRQESAWLSDCLRALAPPHEADPILRKVDHSQFDAVTSVISLPTFARRLLSADREVGLASS
ncbi:methylmalonyl Co-A mutase-associated GTPase MeaB [Paraburkholderia sp. NMBU_R16]|uniref:GTP-binding protein n=1 Tax=Paraburkholderia sp. NMBU_R16 TaxID=2698676 RepID=UPI00156531F7|nr:GTP-binding protein [Paraburkholderia sp. NMBU_R16]NRO99004.1 methylmalonyl Co-A mutase-associated GTPase MeaB [Paraburkholderia sp. NMBU_R16]